MKILVTGATGFLGLRLIEKLDNLNYIDGIITKGRKIRKTHYIESKKIKYLLGDLSDNKFDNQITSEVDILINRASLSSPWWNYSDFEKENDILKYVPKQTTQEAIEEFLEWYKASQEKES